VIRAARVLAALVTAGLLAGLAACSSTTAGHGGKTSVPATGPAAEALAGTWVPATDAETGIRFSLPGAPEKTGVPAFSPSVDRRRYQVQVDQVVEVTVYVDSGATEPARFPPPDTIADLFVAGMRADGNTDVRTLERRNASVQGRPAVDIRLTYTPKRPARGHPVLFLRVVQTPTAVVELQTFTSLGAAATLPTLQSLQAKLVAGLKLA